MPAKHNHTYQKEYYIKKNNNMFLISDDSMYECLIKWEDLVAGRNL